jgi:hypothetical protein
MTTVHQRILLDVAASIGKLVEYYTTTEYMQTDDAIRFAFKIVADLEEQLLAEANEEV